MRLAVLFFLSVSLVKAQAAEPLKLEKTIELPEVQGRIDHLSLDVKGQRLFVSALGNSTVKVIDLKAGKRREKRAAEALAMVGLADRAEHLPSQMSGGQQGRVAIARALVNRPSILLADEPTGNLDSKTSVEIMQILQDLNDKGLTIVLVSHEHDIAQFAKRVLVFRDGTIRKDDLVPNRSRAHEVLKTLPTLED